jgi:hypothetical protein
MCSMRIQAYFFRKKSKLENKIKNFQSKNVLFFYSENKQFEFESSAYQIRGI